MKTKRMLMLVFSMGLLFTYAATSVWAEGEAAAPAPVKQKKLRTAKKKRVLKSAPASVKPATSSTTTPTTPAKAAPKGSMSAWLQDLKKRLSHSKARQNQIVAVAAVRGNETPDSPPLYWKGKKTAGEVEASDLQQFEEAVDQAIDGKAEDSLQKLQAFVTNHPDSPLVADAQETIKKLEEPAAQ